MHPKKLICVYFLFQVDYLFSLLFIFLSWGKQNKIQSISYIKQFYDYFHTIGKVPKGKLNKKDKKWTF